MRQRKGLCNILTKSRLYWLVFASLVFLCVSC
jgi:hypothetical protein